MQPAHVVTLAFASILLTITLAVPTRADNPIPPEALAKIRAAAPDKAPAKPAQPRRVLVYTACKGFVHDAIPFGTAAVETLGRKTGAFEAVASDDPAVFKPESLAKFDAVCFNNATGELFEDDALKQGLLDFVKGGKGIIGLHAATDCFYKWPEFGELMGGYFDGHPWTADCTVTVKIDDLASPINAAFGGQGFDIKDEIYQFKAPYSRDRLRTLLSLDTAKTDMKKDGIKRSDGDFAVSWVRTYGLGRVFYCSLGHRDEIFWNPAVLGHYLAGIQYALGDLPADATPSAQLRPDGWADLFNGKDLTGWIAKPGSWTVEGGVLTRQGGGDIWTEQTFGDFVLDLEFKIAEKSNSGIFLRTSEIKDCVQTGIEVQVLDSFGKAEADKHDCGAVYDCVAPSKNVVKKPGEWNHIVITCHGPTIKVVLNDEPIIDMNLDKWTEAGKNSDGTPNKFKTAYKDMPRTGRIGFQDHNSAVWYRDIKIKRLGT